MREYTREISRICVSVIDSMALGRPQQDCEEDSGPDSDPGSDEDLEEQVVAAEELQTRVATPAVVPSSGDPAKAPSPSPGRPKRGPSTNVKAMDGCGKGKVSENKPITGCQQAADKQPTDDSAKLKRGLIIGGAAVASGVVAMAAAPIVLSLAGFGVVGVVAGSFAAGWQALIGNVAAGSLFAALQSAGAAGLAASTVAAVGAVGAAGGAAVSAVASHPRDHRGATGEPGTPAPGSAEPPSDDDEEGSSAGGGAIVSKI